MLSWPKVRELTDLSRSTAWRRQRAGDFPLAVRISPGRVGWRESEVLAWMVSRTSELGGIPAGRGATADAASTPVRSSEEPVVSSYLPQPATAPMHEAAEAPRVRSQRRSRCEGQIAFDF